MRNSGFSSTVPSWNTCEEEDDDDYCKFFDADGSESPEPEPSFVFKFEYQTREILKQLEIVDEIGHHYVVDEKNSTSCLVEESPNGSAQNSSCDSVEANVHVEEEVEKRVVIEENSVYNEVKFGSVVNEEMSHSDEECDEKVTTSHEDDMLVSSEEFDSDSICSREEDDDELGALEDIGLRKPNGFDEEDNETVATSHEGDEDDELWEVIGLRKPDGFDDKDGSKDTLEALCEQLKSVDKLKRELRKGRATTGLPTIHEESEFVNMDDMKPLKIVGIYQNKVYKSYKTQMRKFDILSHAVGDLESKLSLEVVYVGQLCLSWEILKCQYEKALELSASSPNRNHSYNEVAEELQQFQVLLQRFVEDEHLQGPRVENYVKNRCAMPKLLQVPEIRKDRSDEGKEGSKAITDIVEMLRDSIRTMWQFIRADKNANVTTACRKRSPDQDLLAQVQADLRKKDRMLKELKRSQNRIIKRFLKHEEEEGEEDEDSADHGHLNFFSQVDIRLVSRVLNMSIITKDQLVWCQSTLNKIQFVRSKNHVDTI